MKKVGRNDPCPCGSGKKFKKCCESKMIGKRFIASKIDTASMAQKSAGLSSLFQKTISLPSRISSIAGSLGSHSIAVKNKSEESASSSVNKTDEKILHEEKDILTSSKEKDAQIIDSSVEEDKNT